MHLLFLADHLLHMDETKGEGERMKVVSVKQQAPKPVRCAMRVRSARLHRLQRRQQRLKAKIKIQQQTTQVKSAGAGLRLQKTK